jgi:hypothetical protein
MNAALVWIIGVTVWEIQIQKWKDLLLVVRNVGHTPSQLSRTQRGLERTSAAVRRTAQRSCQCAHYIVGQGARATHYYTVKAFYSALETFER